jgi:regulator of protease activity HflC (stomatin/prohibitin superfamily)
MQLGVEIIFVGLSDIHPPTSVAGAFEAVNGAAQEVQAKVYTAEGEAAKTTLLAQAQALERVRAAEGDAASRTTGATAQGARFANQVAAYQAAPDYYANRLYLQTFARASRATRKYIVAGTNSHQVFQINLEDKIRPDLLDINLTPQNP